MADFITQKGMSPQTDPELLAIEFNAPAFLLHRRHFAKVFAGIYL